MNNKDIFKIDKEYKANLKKICQRSLSFFYGIPLEWEDIYNAFLMEVPKILNEYKESEGGNFKGYLFIQCKYFAHNYCRSFLTNGHQLMNKSVEYKNYNATSLSDVVTLKQPVDTSVFSDLEMLIYRERFLEEKTIKEISDKNRFSIYKIGSIIKNIKVKLILQFKK